MVIGTDEVNTFVFFNYEWLTWITHLDNFDGLNGPAAFVNIKIDLKNRFQLFEFISFNLGGF